MCAREPFEGHAPLCAAVPRLYIEVPACPPDTFL